MEENNVKLTAVPFADTEPVIVFIFTLLAASFFGLDTGFLPITCLPLLGLIQVGALPVYIVAAYNKIKRGEALMGCCFLIFAAVFGGMSGFTNIFMYFANVFSLPFSNKILGFVWFWSGLVLLPVASANSKGPLFPFLVFFLGALQLIVLGINVLFFNSQILTYIVIVLEGLVAAIGCYCWCSVMFIFAGKKPYLGPIMGK